MLNLGQELTKDAKAESDCIQHKLVGIHSDVNEMLI